MSEGNFTNLNFVSCCFREITALTVDYKASKYQLSERENKLKSFHGKKKILKILHFLKHPTCLIPYSGYLENFDIVTFYYLNVQINSFANKCRE